MRKVALIAAGAALALGVSGCKDDPANLSAEELKLMWQDANSECRGGSGDEATTQASCDRRDEIDQKLAAMDWCFTSGEQAAYLSTWRRCSEANAPEVQTERDPFPYTAILTCSLSAFKNTGIPLMACMSSDYNSSSLRVRNGDNLEVLKGWQIQNSDNYVFTDRGLEIPLRNKSSVKITNMKDNLLLSMQVIDNDGNVLYKEVAERLDTLEFNSEYNSNY